MDAERQHENPLGVSVPTCHVQLSRTGLPGMVHLGHRYRQRPVEVQRLARTDTGSVRHEVEVYDTKNHYHFLIEGIERTNIAPVCFYYTLPDPRTAERTDRIRYLQLKEEGTAGVPGFIQKTGLSGGKKKDRQKNAQRQCIAYDYMETDYHTH